MPYCMRMCGGSTDVCSSDLNSDHYLEAMHATWWLGAITVPMNTRWAIAEHLYSARDAGFSIIFVDEANKGCAAELARAEPALGPFIYMRSEEHTYELQSLMRISYAVFCLKNKNTPYILLYEH